MDAKEVEYFFNMMSAYVHDQMSNWWTDVETGEPIKRNMGEMLMLCVTELSEAMEGHRRDLMDNHLPHRKMLEVELADCIIRILDIAGAYDMDLGGAFVEKMAYNSIRYDHTNEARRKDNGKKC